MHFVLSSDIHVCIFQGGLGRVTAMAFFHYLQPRKSSLVYDIDFTFAWLLKDAIIYLSGDLFFRVDSVSVRGWLANYTYKVDIITKKRVSLHLNIS